MFLIISTPEWSAEAQRSRSGNTGDTSVHHQLLTAGRITESPLSLLNFALLSAENAGELTSSDARLEPGGGGTREVCVDGRRLEDGAERTRR